MNMRRRIDVKIDQRQFIMYDDRTCRIDDLTKMKTTWYRTKQLRWWELLQEAAESCLLADKCLLDSAWLAFIAPAEQRAFQQGRRKVKMCRFTLTELVCALLGLAIIGFVVFLGIALVHYALKFW